MIMLKAAKLPIRKTVLMYKARLSYSQLQNYLGLLKERGLVENCGIEGEKGVETFYRTTEKGLSFVESLELVQKLWEI